MTDQKFVPRAERRAAGKLLRGMVPRASHAAWTVPLDRRDPVDLLIESNAGRMPELSADSLWPDVAITLRVFSRSGVDHGGRHSGNSRHWVARAGVWRLPFA